MTYRLGIVPAAGKASRFGGTLKELLPIDEGRTLLSRTVETLLAVCDDVVIVTTPRKATAHMEEVERAFFVLQTEGADLWGSVRAGMRIRADRYYFAMPDTLIPEDAFAAVPDCHLAIGTFETNHPERFGVLHEGRVVDKKYGIPTPARAWGVLAWSTELRDLWRDSHFSTFTDALNEAIAVFGCKQFDLAYYYDAASFRDYRDLLVARKQMDHV